MITVGLEGARRLRSSLVAVALAAAICATTSLTLAPLAAAEWNDYYGPCGSCAQISGPEAHGLTENWASNLSGAGVCSALWNYSGGAWHERLVCTSTGTEACVAYGGEVWSHGQVRRWYAKYEYDLEGLETDDFRNC